MSRIGKMPIPLPSGVEIRVEPGKVTAKGPLGELGVAHPAEITIERDEDTLLVVRPNDERRVRAFHGLTRALVANVVQGVSQGFEKALEIQGVGYRAALEGQSIQLQVGYSHPVKVDPPEGITFEVPAPTRIVVKGISKQAVGQVAANIRKLRPPEPYKGKGIRYEGEYVKRKVGKAAK